LTIAILALVAGTVLVASIGGYFLIQRATTATAQQELYRQARVIAINPALLVTKRPVQCCARLQLSGGYQSLSVAVLTPKGIFTRGLPSPLGATSNTVASLQAAEPVTGSAGSLLYVMIPLNLTVAQKGRLVPAVPPADTGVLVATRAAPTPVGGWGWFVLVALGSLAVATIVASWLAQRFSRPIRSAAHAAGRIAQGDLSQRLAVSRHDGPELAELATAINAMSDSLARARDQQRAFLLSVSHELRTPLTSIRGYAEALADGATDDVQGALEVIGAEARRLERLVGDLLELGQLGAGRFSLHPTAVDVTQVVQEAVDGFRPEAAKLALELTAWVPEPGILWVMADGDRLRQILSNLIENAFKFAASRVAVGARADQRAVVLWVLDDGRGIAEADLPRVFEPHFSSDRTAPERGTGLGLAIVSELASAMGGGVRAESPAHAGRGTRMVVWLPATAAVDGPRPPIGPARPVLGSGGDVSREEALGPRP
jgi:two-component system sensor histidine kinase BaeS